MTASCPNSPGLASKSGVGTHPNRQIRAARRPKAVIIMAYAHMEPEEAAKHLAPRVVFVDAENRITRTLAHGDVAWNAGVEQAQSWQSLPPAIRQ